MLHAGHECIYMYVYDCRYARCMCVRDAHCRKIEKIYIRWTVCRRRTMGSKNQENKLNALCCKQSKPKWELHNLCSLLFIFCFVLTFYPHRKVEKEMKKRDRERGKQVTTKWIGKWIQVDSKMQTAVCTKPKIIRHSRGWFAIFVSFVDLVVVVGRGGSGVEMRSWA